MSRGFVKEGDQEEAPVIPQRAVLPNGIPNYVTPEGFDALQQEKKGLLTELTQNTNLSEREKRRKSTEIDGKLQLLNERINTARILDIKEQSLEKVRFGAKITYTIGKNKKPITIQIVGVDEANTKERKIAFIAPIVKAMIGKKSGETAKISSGREDRSITILSIER